MKCYNLKCKDINDCDKYKKAICLNRKTKEQVELIKEIHGNICEKCFSVMVIAREKYSKRTIKVCTKCKHIELINQTA